MLELELWLEECKKNAIQKTKLHTYGSLFVLETGLDI